MQGMSFQRQVQSTKAPNPTRGPKEVLPQQWNSIGVKRSGWSAGLLLSATNRPRWKSHVPEAALLTACLSRLLVNRIAPPNLLPQHLPQHGSLNRDHCWCWSDQDTKEFPPIGPECTEGDEQYTCRGWMGIKTTALNKLQNGWKRWCRSIIITWTADEWCNTTNTHPDPCATATTAHLLHQLLHKSRHLSNTVWQTPPGDWTVAAFESEIHSRLKLG